MSDNEARARYEAMTDQERATPAGVMAGVLAAYVGFGQAVTAVVLDFDRRLRALVEPSGQPNPPEPPDCETPREDVC